MVRVNRETYERFIGHSLDYKQSKYHNKKVEYNGMKFDSKKEMAYYMKLKLLEKAGEIKNVERQIEYELIPKFKVGNKTYRKTSYFADFRYVSVEDDKIHVVDVKSLITAKNDVYRLKKKLMAYKYGVEIEEV